MQSDAQQSRLTITLSPVSTQPPQTTHTSLHNLHIRVIRGLCIINNSKDSKDNRDRKDNKIRNKMNKMIMIRGEKYHAPLNLSSLSFIYSVEQCSTPPPTE